jgi:hypothetical protein
MRLSILKNLLQLRNASVVALRRAKRDLVTPTLPMTAHSMTILRTMTSLRLKNPIPHTTAEAKNAARAKAGSIARKPLALVAVPVANMKKTMKRQKANAYLPRLTVVLPGLLAFKRLLFATKYELVSLKHWSKPR